MKDRLNEILALKAAHDEYLELLARVQRIVERHPDGLCIKPMLAGLPKPGRLA